MKAADLKAPVPGAQARKPPHTFTLGPRAFSEGWKGRPTGPLRFGMRVASADERMLAHTRAVQKADALLPGVSRDERAWQTTYDIVRFHVLLSFTLTDADDVTKPYWMNQEGALVDFAKAPLGTHVISPRFTMEGLERLHMELEVLTISVTSKVLWPAISDIEARQVGAALTDGTFFRTIASGEGPAEGTEERRKGVEMQIRRLLTYVKHLHDTGLVPSPMDG